jgi:hypothetical protein
LQFRLVISLILNCYYWTLLKECIYTEKRINLHKFKLNK